MKTNLQKIEHVIVLMLENRSFDNMLGWLGTSDGGRQKVNGVAGKELSNPIPAYAPRPRGIKSVRVGIERKMTNPNPDPGEEYAHVNTQLFGRVLPKSNRFSKDPEPPYNLPASMDPAAAPMNGFVTDYINNYYANYQVMPTYDQYKIIMGCHPEEAVPVLSTLAKEYAVCDAWFSSVPSQTLCNRSFMHTATSRGFVLNSPFYHWLLHRAPTIFNRIEEQADPQLTWRVYYDRLDIVSLTGLQNPPLWQFRNTNFCYMDEFFRDARNGNLPSYAFLEPRFLIDHSDQHPPVKLQFLENSSVLAGELLLAQVYRALSESPQWEQTLLIITYDEHGGCYDHVPPPVAVPPEASAPVGEQGFRFDRLGVRVPTVLVSPHIKRGTVISEVHDHTSILKLLETRWGLKPLTERDACANDLSKALNLKTPRTDRVELHPHPYQPSKRAREEPLNDLQKGMVMLVAGYEDVLQIKQDGDLYQKARDLYQLVLDEGRIAHLKTVGDAIHFTMDFDRRTSKRVPWFIWLWHKLKRLFE